MNARKFKFITYFRARGKAIKVKKKNLVSIFACRLKQRRRPLYTGDTFSVSTISWFTDPLPSPSVSSRPAQLLAPRVNRSQATTRAGVGHRYETLHQVTFPSPPPSLVKIYTASVGTIAGTTTTTTTRTHFVGRHSFRERIREPSDTQNFAAERASYTRISG